jgi:demethylmenaquinone methyltransferase/2-methoxy-6-polyprenyl-1,4-benzoquinol methylase
MTVPRGTGSVAAYERAAPGWLRGADPAYRRFADAVVRAAGHGWQGALVVDIGAGTGATSGALRAAGARPVAVDAATGMLRLARGELPGLGCAAGDATSLPFRSDSFDAALAGFCLNHLTDPGRALAEAARVVRPGGAVVASTFATGEEHPAKRIIDDVMHRSGWHPPAWHLEFTALATPLSSTPERLAGLAADVGLRQVRTRVLDVDAGLRSAAELVAWRLGMAQFAEFLRGLDPCTRAQVETACREAVGTDPQPLRRSVLMLSSIVAA